MPEPDISEQEKNVLKLLEEMQKASVSELQAKLLGNPSYSAISRLMRGLVERGLVCIVGVRKTARRPENIYGVRGEGVSYQDSLDFADIEAERVDEWERRGIVIEVIRQLDESFSLLQKEREIFKELANRLRYENPRDLLVGMAKWLKEEHAEAIKKFNESKRLGRQEEKERWDRRIEDLRVLGLKLFNQQLGIPRDDDGPFRLHGDLRTGEDKSELNETSLREYLDRAIIGETVLEKVTNSAQYPTHIVGTDASRHELRLKLSTNPYPEPPPFYVMTSVAVRYDFANQKMLDIDSTPDPRTWVTYTTDQAITDGLIIPPNAALELDETILRHTVEAALNLRQYNKDADMFSPDRRSGAVANVIFRDGRIFPLEHRFQDYIQSGLHGRMVRASIAAFWKILGAVSMPGAPLYCGIVKNPVVEAVGPLVFWYAKYGSESPGETPIWPNMEENYIFRRPIPDQLLVMRIFANLESECSQGERWITFRWIRRFSSMLEEYLSRRWLHDGLTWKLLLEEWISEHDPPYQPDLQIFADLCERAAVVSFFADLGAVKINREEIRVPRYEYLLPHHLASWNIDPKVLCNEERNLSGRLLNALSDPRALQPYEDWMGPDAVSTPLLVPIVIRHAHELSKDVAKLYKEEFLGHLSIAAFRYLNDKIKGGTLGTA